MRIVENEECFKKESQALLGTDIHVNRLDMTIVVLNKDNISYKRKNSTYVEMDNIIIKWSNGHCTSNVFAVKKKDKIKDKRRKDV